MNFNNQKINKDFIDNYIHWWQFPLDKLSIKLNKGFKDKFFEEVYRQRSKSLDIADYINKKSKLYNKSLNFSKQRALLWEYKRHLDFIPAWIIYELAQYLGIDLLEIERNIIAYISYRGRIKIISPKLPIKITPLMSSLLLHMICDGTVCDKHMFYFQKNKEHLNRFINIVKEIFGNYESNCKRGHYAPLLFYNIISKFYNTKNYTSFLAEIPDRLKNQSKQFKVAALASALLDDGSSNSSIRFYSASKKYIEGIKEIAESLGYKCTKIIRKDIYSINISAKSLDLFYKDLTELFKEYPILYIGRKYDELKKFVEIRERGWNQRRKFETKNMILNSLKKRCKTALQLREEINISLWTIYHHLQRLMKLNKVRKYKISKREYAYEVV